MKKPITILTIMLAVCAGSQNASAIVSTMQGNAQGTSVKNKVIRPMDSGIDIKNLKDATMPADFSVKDFDWNKGTLKITIFNMDLYDAVDIAQLKVGDVVLYDGKKVTVEKIDTKDGVDINGGYEEGGISLAPGEGGTYRGWSYDDYATYSEVGTVKLPLSENLIINDCASDPQAPSIIIKKNYKQYIDSLNKDYGRNEFNYLNTEVRIENGIITNITRHWIP